MMRVMMTTTFDEPESTPEWDKITEAVNTVHVRRAPTIDDLLDLRNQMSAEIALLGRSDDARVGVMRARNMLDNLLASL